MRPQPGDLVTVDGVPQEIRWTDPVSDDQAEVLLAELAVIARDAGLDDLAAPVRH